MRRLPPIAANGRRHGPARRSGNAPVFRGKPVRRDSATMPDASPVSADSAWPIHRRNPLVDYADPTATDTLLVDWNVATPYNPISVQYLIQAHWATTAADCATSTNEAYVQAGGNLGLATHWSVLTGYNPSDTDYARKAVNGLSSLPFFCFRIKARNGDNIETPWSDWGFPAPTPVGIHRHLPQGGQGCEEQRLHRHPAGTASDGQGGWCGRSGSAHDDHRRQRCGGHPVGVPAYLRGRIQCHDPALPQQLRLFGMG